jgi:hypothetical protein
LYGNDDTYVLKSQTGTHATRPWYRVTSGYTTAELNAEDTYGFPWGQMEVIAPVLTEAYTPTAYGIYSPANSSIVNVSGGEIVGAHGIFMGDGTGTSNITGGTIRGLSGMGIRSNYATVNISGAETYIEGTTYGVSFNRGTGLITGGTIAGVGDSSVGVYIGLNGTLTIGTNESGTPSVSTVEPSITGVTKGLQCNQGSFNFYDGEIIGATGQSIVGTPSATPTDYSVKVVALSAVKDRSFLSKACTTHTWGDWTNYNVYTHHRTCTTCGDEEFQEHRSLTYEQNNASTHYKKCGVCYARNSESHNWEVVDEHNGIYLLRCRQCQYRKSSNSWQG